MDIRRIKIAFLAFCGILAGVPKAEAQLQLDDRHINVALRMIGHEMLLNAGDSSSRVLPIQKNEDTYQLSFESSFSLQPDDLVQLVDSVVKQANIARAYLVEVQQCETGEVVYSFEMGLPGKVDLVPCKGRELPVDCYSILFSIIEYPLPTSTANPAESNLAPTRPPLQLPMAVMVGLLIIITSLWVYFRKKPGSNEVKANVIPLGAFAFDTRNMQLWLKGEKTELTSRESDLLLLLYKSNNTTIERAIILNRVWGDEGDYVGRTLDVFISKLRKKLEADPSLKIVNVRGVGYKLVVNE